MKNSQSLGQSVSVSNLEIQPFQSLEQAALSLFEKDNSVIPGFAIAINAEKILTYRENAQAKALIDSATLRFADGIPIVWLMQKKGVSGVRIPGCELWLELMRLAGIKDKKVFILGASSEVNSQVCQKLRQQFGVNIVGSEDGFFSNENDLIQKLILSDADIVTVAMGSPKQEFIIGKCREQYPKAFYLGVGGTYDVYSGRVSRAPSWICQMHLEWAYRLLRQPTRVRRQGRILKFIGLALLGRF